MYRVGQKTGPFLKCITPVHDDIGKPSIYQNVQLFIRSKTGILSIFFAYVQRNDATPKIAINLSMTFNYCTQFPQN